MNLRHKRALITGAASGIGFATAEAFGERGADLIITDIDEGGLEAARDELESSGTRVQAHTVDVTDAEAMESLAETVHEDGPVDVLVNNAGVGVGGGILDTSLDDWNWVIDVNLRGVVHGVHFFAPEMQPGSHIINIASVAGLMASAQLGAYSTTKFAVVGLSEALKQELEPADIAVTAICPGFISTNIARSMRYVGRMADARVQDRVKKMLDTRGAEPSLVAHAILDALDSKRGVMPVTAEAWAFYFLKRLIPEHLSVITKAVEKLAT
jgi:NAD(P)-dependent dehydrogenase (short-subunit alcohol dehydrogenase family)